MSSDSGTASSDIVAILQRTDGTECRAAAREVTLDSLTVTLEPVAEPLGDDDLCRTQFVRLQAPDLETDIESLCKVEKLAALDGETTVRLRVLDWIGLRAQLPGPIYALFSLRDSSRYRPSPQDPISVHFTADALYQQVNLFDLSPTGLSVLVPPQWFDRVDPGDDVKVGFQLTGHPFVELQGVVRHVHVEDSGRSAGLGWENRRLVVGIAFDEDATPDFALKRSTIQAYLESRRRR